MWHKYLQFFKYFYLLFPKNRRYFYLINPFSMQNKLILFALSSLFLATVNFSCSKNDDTPPPAKTNTELITKATWKFNKATVSGIGDVSAFLETCKKDNKVTFIAAGTGTADEGATKCNPGDPQTAAFTWSFQTSESVLFVSTPLFTGGSSTFTIVSLTETELVVSQNITISGISQNAEITFIH